MKQRRRITKGIIKMFIDKETGKIPPNLRIRIITNADIRYEGTLFNVNAAEKTISLKEVTAFGTEERRSDTFIPPSSKVYDCVIFRSCEIKDLVGMKGDLPPAKSEPQAAPPAQEQTKSEPPAQKKAEPAKIAEQKPDKKEEKQLPVVQKVAEKAAEKAAEEAPKKQIEEPKASNDFFDDFQVSAEPSGVRDREEAFRNRRINQETFGPMTRPNFNRPHYANRGRNQDHNKGHNDFRGRDRDQEGGRRPYKPREEQVYYEKKKQDS